MAKHTPVLEFTAQGPTVVALNDLFAKLISDPSPHPEIAPIVVFMAFAIESYLNSLGSRHIVIWDDLEKLPWKTKIILLHDKAGKSLNWGESPLQFVKEVFELRDKLAHGKPEIMRGPSFADKSNAEAYAAAMGLDPELRDKHTPKWYLKLNREWAMRSLEKHKATMNYLAHLFSLPENDYLMLATGRIKTDDSSNA
jgi:hypothetical protein